MSANIDDKVTDLAKTALAKPDSWVTVVVLMLWCWWMSYQLQVLTQKLLAEKMAALEKKLSADEAAQKAAVAQIQADVDRTAAEAAAAAQVLRLVEQRIDGDLLEAEAAKLRVSKLKKWEELDALAQGR